MFNSFKLCSAHFSRRAKKFEKGVKPPLITGLVVTDFYRRPMHPKYFMCQSFILFIQEVGGIIYPLLELFSRRALCTNNNITTKAILSQNIALKVLPGMHLHNVSLE